MQKAEDEASRLVGNAQIKTAQVELMVEAMKRERDEARAIISDLLEERGQSWLGQLVKRRAELARLLLDLERKTQGPGRRSCVCEQRGHGPKCALGEFLRIVGGTEEIEHQASEAYEEAIREMSYRRFGVDLGQDPDRALEVMVRYENGRLIALNNSAVTSPPLNAVRSGSDLRDPSHSPQRPE